MAERDLASRPRRAQCTRCLRPASACICAWIRPTANEVEVLILQHPLEVAQAKGSAKLLELSLAHCEVLVGEALDAELLRAHLYKPMADGRSASPALLYPDTTLLGVPPPASAAPNRLVIIDGTWHKSLKMLHANPLLQALPRMALKAAGPSRYVIRKAPRPGQLSTLEAACMALSELEASPARYAPLTDSFDLFVVANRSSSERHTTRLRPPRLAS